jgi:hypothetical protein
MNFILLSFFLYYVLMFSKLNFFTSLNTNTTLSTKTFNVLTLILKFTPNTQ